MKVDTPANSWGYVVVRDAEVGPHVLPPHPVDLQGVAVPRVHQSVLGSAQSYTLRCLLPNFWLKPSIKRRKNLVFAFVLCGLSVVNNFKPPACVDVVSFSPLF